eukprot:COSAG06_NODE_40052_length_406_cov_0.671010_2_plen_20_part_01
MLSAATKDATETDRLTIHRS